MRSKLSRNRSSAAALAALLAALTIVLAAGPGCLGVGGEDSPAGVKAGGRAPAGVGRAAGGGDLDELAALLREGAKPGQLSDEDKARIEEALLVVLPETTGGLAGLEWEVTYLDMDEGDFFSAELRRPDAEFGEKEMWFHILYRPDMPADERASYGMEDFEGYRGMGMEDTHYFILVGATEIRAVADSDEFKDDDRILGTLRAFKLDEIARL
jgi:hypothetical protein